MTDASPKSAPYFHPVARHRGAKLHYMCLGTALVLAGLLLASCSGGPRGPGHLEERPVEELYNGAVNAMADRKFEQAVNLFDEVERQHPYSVFATKSQLNSAYSSYSAQDYDSALSSLDRFIELHPGNRDVAYAYYLRALSYYDQIADVARDQQLTQKAVDALNDVIRRFPDSDYARDATIKLDLANDHLAGKEMDVGRFYLARKNYTAAITRFQNVVDFYDTTTHVPEALYRLVETYTALGLAREARETAAVLGHNYPGNEWYIDGFELVTGEEFTEEQFAGQNGENKGFLRRLWPF